METEEMHRRTVDWWRSCVETVGEDEWGAPTPCASWDVRKLVNHVAGEDLWTVPLLEGSTIEDVGDRFDGDVLGDDPVDSARSAAGSAVTAVADLLPQRDTVHLSYGEERADEYIWQLAADHLIHGWDLAVATGGDTRLDPELVAALDEWYSSREEMYRGAGAVGARVALNGDAQHDLLARFGRDEDWAPTAS
ncbi:TIGR03086 family metal-binding protein [Nocardioides bizhenqiangii]|uniref:TIGR03086 family metal-binding protein n=1 Tax=Nocardioides bizhenqiangii TaxID=3095076 RepID=A0ABZ0ZVA4_9ACTN|nr:TIGR03086 family metal-binding protein [Nocardioides sp. HM61]WQQ27891.1 TIGR03086 family metal-binding protein [Nocardioides sp. HM61]